jgi:nicotinamide-nucleotide amidase
MEDKILTKIHKRLLRQKKTIAIAESCTGGMLCAELTRNPGASAYFLLGVVTYSNKSKQKILKIPAKLISNYGAVSRQVAILMANSIRKISKANLGIGITGLAGPNGATPDKPIGTVFVCLSFKKINICRKFSFSGKRNEIRSKTTQEALRLLCAYL